jgi:hypothetical protein
MSRRSRSPSRGPHADGVRTGPTRWRSTTCIAGSSRSRPAIPRAARRDADARAGHAAVLAGRRRSGSDADYRVAIDVQRFESRFADGATLDAAWTVTPGAGSRALGAHPAQEPLPPRPCRHRRPPPRALEKLAKDLAAAIRPERPSSPAPTTPGKTISTRPPRVTRAVALPASMRVTDDVRLAQGAADCPRRRRSGPRSPGPSASSWTSPVPPASGYGMSTTAQLGAIASSHEHPVADHHPVSPPRMGVIPFSHPGRTAPPPCARNAAIVV